MASHNCLNAVDFLCLPRHRQITFSRHSSTHKKPNHKTPPPIREDHKRSLGVSVLLALAQNRKGLSISLALRLSFKILGDIGIKVEQINQSFSSRIFGRIDVFSVNSFRGFIKGYYLCQRCGRKEKGIKIKKELSPDGKPHYFCLKCFEKSKKFIPQTYYTVNGDEKLRVRKFRINWRKLNTKPFIFRGG